MIQSIFRPVLLRDLKIISLMFYVAFVLFESLSSHAQSPAEPAMPATAAIPPITPVVSETALREMAGILHVSPILFQKGNIALELVYARRYTEAAAAFKELNELFPNSPAPPLGRAMIAQSMMGENVDFSRDADYMAAFEEALKRCDAAISRGEAEAWHRFLRGYALGVNGIYQYRKDKFFGALKDGWSALKDLEKAREIEPRFIDPQLGLGVYNYWASALTKQYKDLPFVTDRRKEGLDQIELAKNNGIFAPTLARLALGYSYWHAGKTDKAYAASKELYDRYPDNVINLLLLGQLQYRKQQFDQARASYMQVLKIAPENAQAYLFLGNLEFRRGGDLKQAQIYFERFISTKPVAYYDSMARVRLGDTYWLLGELNRAEQEWKVAASTYPNYELADARMDGKRPAPRSRKPSPDAPPRRVVKTPDSPPPAP